VIWAQKGGILINIPNPLHRGAPKIPNLSFVRFCARMLLSLFGRKSSVSAETRKMSLLGPGAGPKFCFQKLSEKFSSGAKSFQKKLFRKKTFGFVSPRAAEEFLQELPRSRAAPHEARAAAGREPRQCDARRALARALPDFGRARAKSFGILIIIPRGAARVAQKERPPEKNPFCARMLLSLLGKKSSVSAETRKKSLLGSGRHPKFS